MPHIRLSSLLLLCLLATVACRSARTVLPAEVSSLHDEIRRLHAPDKRVAVLAIDIAVRGKTATLSGESNLPEAVRDLSERLVAKGYVVDDQVQRLPAADLAGKIYGVVNVSACNMRSEGRHAAELATQATLGTPLRVLKKQKGWYLVQTPDDYLGWLDPGGFAAMTAEEMAAWKAAPKAVYMPDFGLALAAPGMDAERMADLLAGNIFRKLGTTNGYVQLGYPDGREAFVPEADVMGYEEWLATRRPSPENILATARSMMGRPYLWGGTSGKAMDCSGFTKTVFFLNGLLMPRDASQQVHVGEDLPADTTLQNLLPGDLLFFGDAATPDKKERVTHVAIYEGDGRILHASARVMRESLRRGDPDFTEYRLRTYLRARRMLHQPGQHGVPWVRDKQ